MTLAMAQQLVYWRSQQRHGARRLAQDVAVALLSDLRSTNRTVPVERLRWLARRALSIYRLEQAA